MAEREDGDKVIEVSAREVVPVERVVEERFREAEAEINAWLDEAVDEGAAIVERARAEAARLQIQAHEHAERLRQAAEKAASDAGRAREQLLREAEAEAAERRAEASERMAEAIRLAEAEASERRRSAADEAALLLADAERRRDDGLRQIELQAAAREDRAAATVASLQADVGLLQQQLTQLVEHAIALLPALDNAAKHLAARGAELTEAEVESLPAAEKDERPPVGARGLGQLTPRDELEEEGSELFEEPPAAVMRRRPLGRLLGRRSS